MAGVIEREGGIVTESGRISSNGTAREPKGLIEEGPARFGPNGLTGATATGAARVGDGVRGLGRGEVGRPTWTRGETRRGETTVTDIRGDSGRVMTGVGGAKAIAGNSVLCRISLRLSVPASIGISEARKCAYGLTGRRGAAG